MNHHQLMLGRGGSHGGRGRRTLLCGHAIHAGKREREDSAHSIPEALEEEEEEEEGGGSRSSIPSPQEKQRKRGRHVPDLSIACGWLHLCWHYVSKKLLCLERVGG